ncbi:MAG: heavy metal translocating P-type ATPase metal-binding domain-containing protein, partial [Nitrospirae bacterium]|nr:heavy metal translocating P-type ATPase metal-binding domain-containing protein [Nitrospirota bacterium]
MATFQCDHCLLTFPEREAVYDEIDGEKKVFCCNGCSGIYRLIHEEELDDFYEKRRWDDAGIPAALFKKELDIKPFTEFIRDNDSRKEIDVYI